MNETIFEAAAQLQRLITAPAGAVNTMVQSRSAPPYIRVLIEPIYWNSVNQVPDNYHGFPVKVEKREPGISQ